MLRRLLRLSVTAAEARHRQTSVASATAAECQEARP